MNLVGQRMSQLRNKSERSEAVRSQRTGKETLKVLLADTPLPEHQPVVPVESKPHVILYLRHGVNPADRNFTKYPNEIHNLMAEKLNVYENVACVWIWRISWGFGNNYCRFGQRDILKKTSISSLRTVQRVIKGLREKRFIIAALNKDGERESTNRGSLYRVCSPREILHGRVEEGISLEDIPTEGVVCEAMPSEAIPENTLDMRGCKGIAREAIPREAIASETSPQTGDSTTAREAIPPEAILSANLANPVVDSVPEESEQYRQRGYTLSGAHLKDNKDSLKDSLSQEDIISNFYKGIGQEKISKTKRERAENSFKELQRDGFSPEDIQFAVEWILKNAKEEPYDFSIITHTIGQAMADREKAEAEEARRLKEKRIALEKRAEEETQERERASMEAYKKSLSTDKREELRERALEELRNTNGIKEEFIGNILIEAKENEILKLEMEKTDEKEDSPIGSLPGLNQ